MRMKNFFISILFILFFIMFLSQCIPFPSNHNSTYAAGNLNVTIAKDSTGKYLLSSDSVTLKWSSVTDAVYYTIEYYDHQGSFNEVAFNPPFQSVIQHEITGLQKDFIYEFNVNAEYTNPALNETFVKKVITGITFEIPTEIEDGRITDTPIDLEGGGRQVGSRPGLKFKWKIPQIYKEGSVQIFDEYESLDYRITWGTDTAGTNKSQINIRYSTLVNKYIATIFDGTKIRTIAEEVDVNVQTPGYITFDCYGPDATQPLVMKKGDNVQYPSAGEDPGFDLDNMLNFPENPDGSINYDEVDLSEIYYNADIKPGTVYKAKIEPRFRTAYDPNVVAFLPASLTRGYTYTPLRFQISKDSLGNIIVTIFKVNQEDKDAGNTVNFMYEVEYATNEEFFGSITSARQTDEFSSGQSMVIFIENRNYFTPFYYKLVAWSPAEDEILSSDPMEYTISLDTSMPPLPENLEASEIVSIGGNVTNTFYPSAESADNEDYSVKSAEVTLRWSKPLAYNDFLEEEDPTQQVYFHVLLSTKQIIEENGDELIDTIFGNQEYAKEYDSAYRDVCRININACTLEGEYLEFTIDGLSLFKSYEKVDDEIVSTPYFTEDYDDYPTYLLPNKTYFVKMYSMRDFAGEGSLASDMSLTISFTTPIGIQTELASPACFDLKINGIPEENIHTPIILEWQKISYDIADFTEDISNEADVYYDLYMSDGRYIEPGERNQNLPNFDYQIGNVSQIATFFRIGTQEVESDVSFNGYSSPTSQLVSSSIDDFPNDEDVSGVFGESIKKDTTYFFIVKSRLVIEDEDPVVSSPSNIIAVTTLKGSIIEPGVEYMKPRMPTDYKIAIDSSGSPIIDSNAVTLQWSDNEEGERYTLIRTSLDIANEDTLSSIIAYAGNQTQTCFEYKCFEDEVDNLTYDSETGIYSYRADNLKANSLYYFSLRAEKTFEGTQEATVSKWTTLPVTTTLISAPEDLNIIQGSEIGITWTANDVFNASDFSFKANDETVSPINTFVSEDYHSEGTSRFYARITSLQQKTGYDITISASKIDENDTVRSFYLVIPDSKIDDITNTARTVTGDKLSEIDVKWTGLDGYTFEIAVKAENDTEYTVLREGSGFSYTSIEKPFNYTGTNYSVYYARLHSLDPNTKYYIKVRSYEFLSRNALGVNEYIYSVYIGPVSSRTEYSSSKMEEEEQIQKRIDRFNSSVGIYNVSCYWPLEDTEDSYRIKLKASKSINYIDNTTDDSFVINLSLQANPYASKRGVYIPLAVIRQINESNKDIVIKTPKALFTIRPYTINPDSNYGITVMENDINVKDIFVYIEFNNIDNSDVDMPEGMRAVSDIQEINISAIGLINTDNYIENQIKNWYDYYKEQYLEIVGSYAPIQYGGQYVEDTALENYLLAFKNELMEKTVNTIEGTSSSEIRNSVVDSFETPLKVKIRINIDTDSKKVGYLFSNGNWLNCDGVLNKYDNSSVFNILNTGIVALMSYYAESEVLIPEGHWAENEIKEIASSYDISGVFASRELDNYNINISKNETSNLLNRIVQPGQETNELFNAQQTADKIGFGDVTNFYNGESYLTREELSAILIRLFEIKTRLDSGIIKPKKVVAVNDSNEISPYYYNYVSLCIDFGCMTLDYEGNFRPKNYVSRAEVLSAIARILNIAM